MADSAQGHRRDAENELHDRTSSQHPGHMSVSAVRLNRCYTKSVRKALQILKQGDFSGFCEALAVQSIQEKALSITLAQPQAFDCPLIGVSKGFENLTGFKKEEVLGRNCRFLNRGCTICPKERVRLREALRAGKQYDGILQNRRRNGETFLNLLNLRTLRVGSTFYSLGIQMEVTGRDPDPARQFVLQELEAIVETIYSAQQDVVSQLQDSSTLAERQRLPFQHFDDLTAFKSPSSAAFVSLEKRLQAKICEAKNTFLVLSDSDSEQADRLSQVSNPRSVCSEPAFQTYEELSADDASNSGPQVDTSKMLQSMKEQHAWLADKEKLSTSSSLDKDSSEAKCGYLPAYVPADAGQAFESSAGSYLHPEKCTPCSFHCYSLVGCNRGKDCTFCHEDHPRKPRRRSKKKHGSKVPHGNEDEAEGAQSDHKEASGAGA
eukprot:TRINITY_DN105995_c0_g1_i1.p1 TRINITY_DN105995_c0_g1~~TRINITY_DN105995_c0_g1_i1.p1  ORF type:complete len:435 (-),score=72.01 TRINITY_DN105995_c0_g1_i1:72-1376(-)